MTSIIIPARNEPFLSKTILDILAKAKGNIEILVMLDGVWPSEQKREYWSTPAIIEDPRVIYVYRGESRGMRNAINSAVSMAKGQYLLKCDAHVLFAEGFDEVLKKDIEDNWIVIPRRKRLDAEKWEIQNVGKPDVDYEYLCSPATVGAKGSIWTERILERLGKPKFDLDENLSFQGSCWFMTHNHFTHNLIAMDEFNYGTFVREAQEIGLKTWLGGGKVMINKKTWYAHLHKGNTYGRGYFLNKAEMIKGEKFCDDFWYGNRWIDRKYDLAWLIERFMPIPGWDTDLIEKVRAR